ncbi:hypothetical protein [Kamptonema formosum]|uniref:hypothetical protein n=1 Tax=Kamptonema formosum TaxID=331992 RepID=UPI00034A7AA7|nr:hypothetical protein [Oscillatoria sp. PCC 10802]
MNQRLVESLAQIILSLSQEERQLLDTKIAPPAPATLSPSLQQEVLALEKRLQTFEAQYQMSSEEFYQRFRAGELGDAMDFFEWNVFYEMWKSAQNLSESFEAKST